MTTKVRYSICPACYSIVSSAGDSLAAHDAAVQAALREEIAAELERRAAHYRAKMFPSHIGVVAGEVCEDAAAWVREGRE